MEAVQLRWGCAAVAALLLLMAVGCASDDTDPGRVSTSGDATSVAFMVVDPVDPPDAPRRPGDHVVDGNRITVLAAIGQARGCDDRVVDVRERAGVLLISLQVATGRTRDLLPSYLTIQLRDDVGDRQVRVSTRPC